MLMFRFLYHLKQKVGNKAQVEGSIVKAILMEEISNFCTYYFEPHVDTKAKGLGLQFDDGDTDQRDQNMPEIFSYSMGYSPSRGEVGYLVDRDYNAAHAYVVGNCETLKKYERYAFTKYTKIYFDINVVLRLDV